jgi:hypothetical protein
MDMTEVFVVAIGCFALFVAMPAVIAFGSYKEKKLKLQAKSGSSEMQGQLSHALAEIEQLRNRVAVLEKLATDEDRQLAQKIEGLRQARP